MNFSLTPFAPENLTSRDGFGSPVPRQPAHLDTQAESGAYLRDSYRYMQQQQQHAHFMPIVGLGKRGAYQLVHDELTAKAIRAHFMPIVGVGKRGAY